jgi:hypothetical protein
VRRLRVCIYGGTDLQGMPSGFISALAYQILNSMPSVIVTGGFVRSDKNREAVSTDAAALQGARRYAQDKGVNLKDCYEAWIPEPSLDGRRHDEGVVRMTDEDGIAVRVMAGRTALGRRLAMVAEVDVIVTISGKQHTEVVIEQALELGVPVLPIPDAGGDSKNLLNKYYQWIAASFDAEALRLCLAEVSKHLGSQPDRAASEVVKLIRTAKVGKCLVLFPYDDEHNRLYDAVIEPAVERHMIPLLLGRLPASNAIYTSFADAMQTAAAVIADVTVLNDNVMYEVGFAHGRALTPLIYTRDKERLLQLPVYFRTLNVRLAPDSETIRSIIDEYLRSLKGIQKVHQLNT